MKKTKLLVVAALIFLTSGTTGCGQDTDIRGTKIPKDHPYRSGKVAGVVDETNFKWGEDGGIALSVRDDKQLTTHVVLNYKPDREKIIKSGDDRKKYNDLKTAFNNKYHGTRVECEADNFYLPSEEEKEPGILGAIFGRCKQAGEPVGDWLLSQSMVVEFDSVAQAKRRLREAK